MTQHVDAMETGRRYRINSPAGTRIQLKPHPKSPNRLDDAALLEWVSNCPRPWAIDLFCGAGGLSLGLEESGFSVIAAADHDPDSMATHSANHPSLAWTGDLSDPGGFISRLDDWGIDTVDLVAGGPPCQPFSSAGAAKIGNLVKRGARDPYDKRADLWRSFFAIVDRVRPRAMLFENVPNFAHAQGGTLLMALIDELGARGYSAHVEVLRAWKFRVPQHRSRLFVVGLLGETDFEWPKSRHRKPTVMQAIGDLPIVPAGTRSEIQQYAGPPGSMIARRFRKGLGRGESRLVRDHITRQVRPDDAEVYAALNPGDTYQDVPEHLRRYRSDTFLDKYVRLRFDGLARSITAHIAKDGYWYIHPGEDRTLSIREAARIQTFPDRFRFAGSPTSRYRQIGNAVPPLMALAVGSSIYKARESSPTCEDGSRSGQKHAAFREKLIGWFNANRRSFPWRRSDVSAWQVLMIEMCLHRTRAEQVAQIAEDLLVLGQTPASFVANSRVLEPLLASLGLKWRSRNMTKAAEYVQSDCGGVVPDTWQELIAIPGVGTYIASAVMCFAHGLPNVIVDTNTRRIARRACIDGKSKSDWRLRMFLGQLSGPPGPNSEWNQALLDLGALICTSRKPNCDICPVRSHCATGLRSQTQSRGAGNV